MSVVTAPGTGSGAVERSRLSASVLVASYQRPDDLRRCLTGLTALHRRPDAVIVVSSPEDLATTTTASSFTDRLPVVVVQRRRPGLAAAYEAGFGAAATDVVAVIDDDAVARPDWLGRVVRLFEAHPEVGAVGGRDCIDEDEVSTSPSSRIGRVTRSGKLHGNHHRGSGDRAFTIDHLKGVNMSFRVSAVSGLPLGELVAGTGAQHGNELFTSLWVTRRGHRILYDPAVRVDHYMAPRPADDLRVPVVRERIVDDVRNQVGAFIALAPLRLASAVALRAALIGTRAHPGLVVGLVEVRGRGARVVVQQTRATIAGVRRGVVEGLEARRRSN